MIPENTAKCAERKNMEKEENIYRRKRKEAGFKSCLDAADKIGCSDDTLQRIETGKIPFPDQVVGMSEAYETRELYVHYCYNQCPIGEKIRPGIATESDLKTIALETISSVNSLYDLKKRLIEIAKDGSVSKDEEKDFEIIKGHIQELGDMASSLNLFMEEFLAKKK